MNNSPLSPLPVEFTFAGFSFPRYIADLPEPLIDIKCYAGASIEMFWLARMAARKATLRKRRDERAVCGPYYVSPTPNSKARGIGFYASDDAGTLTMGDGGTLLRVEYTGAEYSTSDGEATFYGIVARLPKSRGFLAGWTMGPGMASSLDTKSFDSFHDAQTAADCLTESAVWEESQHQAANEQAQELGYEIERLTDSVREYRARHSAYVIARAFSTGPTVARRAAEMRTMREDTHTLVDRIRELEQRHNDNFARRGY